MGITLGIRDKRESDVGSQPFSDVILWLWNEGTVSREEPHYFVSYSDCGKATGFLMFKRRLRVVFSTTTLTGHPHVTDKVLHLVNGRNKSHVSAVSASMHFTALLLPL